MLTMLMLAFVQNVSFSIVSRARNRSSFLYHATAASASNVIWFVTFRQLVLAKMDFWLLFPYTIGTVCGSLFGAKLSMWFETYFHATSDEHIK